MEDDTRLYMMAVKDLIMQPVQGPSGTYHVKNGIVFYGYEEVPFNGFSVSQHAWNIFH
jgi:hypothetical protein